ncbi:MAG TPA: response regulator [Dongiaceae bacterium]|nr:response regulator [Dongiaceae bacterium]
MSSFTEYFSSNGFMPHGHCYLWKPELLWLNVISDSLIALAYMTIPFTLIYFVRKRRDIPFDWMLMAFGVFILACGATHITEIWVIWNPSYWFMGVIKAITAAASVITAILLVKLVPMALQIPSPSQLEKVNQQLLISNQESLHAKEQAEIANQAKGTFLTNVSHELRTPLNVIVGYAQMLKRTLDLPERQRKGVIAIQQSGQQLLALISDILDLSKIDAGKITLAPRPVQLPRFLKDIIDMVSVRAAQKGLELYYSPDPELPDAVLVDDQRLRQVLLNLLSNAIKFTDAGSVRLTVNAIAATPGHTDLYFEVTDSGVGMSEDDLKIAFNSFEQVGDIERRVGGSGLGLDISQQLVSLMKGKIQATSTLGVGSRFRFLITVPLCSDEVSVQPDAPIPTGYAGSPRRVLVVDDITENRELLLEFLDSLGFVVNEASDGASALTQMEEWKPDLVILDYALPSMRGDELARRIRTDDTAMPIIMASASATPDTQQNALRAGVNYFLSKPIDQEALVRHLGELLQLDWKYDSPLDKVSVPLPEIRPPSNEILRSLHRLALTGDFSAINRLLENLAEEDAQYSGFTKKLREIANSFDSAAVVRFLERYISG